jgi:hypothetical protein
VAAQVDAALVSRTGAGPPATDGVPVTLPSVFAPASPEHAVASPQSTLAVAVLDAVFADADPSNRVSLVASQAPPRATQLAAPLLSRSAPADPLVIAVPRPSQAAAQSTSASATTDSPSSPS